MKRIIQTNEAPQAIGPYSQGVIANGMLYASGQIAIDPKVGDIVAKDIKGQVNPSYGEYWCFYCAPQVLAMRIL